MTERTEAIPSAEAGDGVEMDGWAPVVPYFDLKVQQEIGWRDGDIVISVPTKSGTTWMMNIVHQLRAGGDSGFDDVYVEVPWLELVASRTVTRQDLIGRFDSMPADRRRAFKTHSAVGALPYIAADSGTDVRYVVVLRNPDEVLASFYPFIQSISPGWFEYWGMDKSQFATPDFDSFYEGFAKLMLPGLFRFLAAWWPLRHESNVKLVHFSNLKRDREGSVRGIADFLGFAPTPAEWTRVLEYTSFSWMKANEDKFEARLAGEVPMLLPGGMVRKGAAGTARDDGVTPQMSMELRRLGEELLADADALEWLYSGGDIGDRFGGATSRAASQSLA